LEFPTKSMPSGFSAFSGEGQVEGHSLCGSPEFCEC
jgi:hypothetical protein